MALDPAGATLDDRPDPELKDMTRRMIVGILLGVPLMALAMTDMIVPGQPIVTAIGYQAVLILQAVLAVPIVFWCGWPLLTRGWVSIRQKLPNMFTLIAVGVLAATAYSFAALVYDLFGIDPTAAVPNVSGDTAAHKISESTRIDPSQTTQGVRVGLTLLAKHHGLVEPFFESAAGIVVLVLIGQVMELRARRRTGQAIRQLMTLTPNTAHVVLPDGREEELPLELVEVGDRVRVKPGQRIPVDGVIREGTSAIDESAITGEPLRVEKSAGSAVMAGTSNGLGALQVEVTKASADSILAHVIHLVGQAQRTRVPLQRTVDRIARWFVPLVFLAATLTFAGWLIVGGIRTHGDWNALVRENWITYAVVCAVGVLIIACPCALGLATPMAVVAGVGRAARQGILFRDASAIEKLTQITTVMFDKTGTLTSGKPRLTGVEGGIMEEPDHILRLAAAVERGSEHPLGLAVVWEAVNRKLDIPIAEDVQAVPGKGVKGIVNGERVVVGNRQFLQENGVLRELMPAELARHRLYGHGVMMVGAGERCLGLIVVEDPVRPTSKEAVSLLKSSGLRVVLVSGDHADTTNAVARSVGIEEVVADTLPAEKFAVVKRFQNEGQKVAMAGDGINDAPALAAADVGIALGTGSDVAMNTAGVTLVKPDLRAISDARLLGAATVRTIRQNLWLAFLYNVLAIPVAAGLLVPFGGGLISPVWAAAAMSLSSISVILNSLRLGRLRIDVPK
jgi:Cu+-exporting ATPase